MNHGLPGARQPPAVAIQKGYPKNRPQGNPEKGAGNRIMDNTHSFQTSLRDPDDFTLTFELVPSRGGRSREHVRALAFAREAAEDGRLRAVSITENAGGHAALSPEVLGVEIRRLGLDVIVHFSCKDKNRNQMESLLFAWDRLGLRNLLVLAGDYPKPGYQGLPKPVFDLDSVQALDLIGRMNQAIFGADQLSAIADPAEATAFFRGVVVSPFKMLESELRMQYAKLHRKAAAGATFVITQLGYDARKFQEVLFFLQANHLDLPVLGNVFIPNLTVTELMYRGEIPGCVIPEPLYRQIRQEAAASTDKGKGARLERAAKLLAVLKGLGFAGAHIGGPALAFGDVKLVMDRAEELAGDWAACQPDLNFWPDDAFYYFKRDEATTLNQRQPLVTTSPTAGRLSGYGFTRRIHDLVFTPAGPLHTPAKKLCLFLAATRLAPGLAGLEHLIKFLAFHCQNCGDCSLAELAYLCPQSGCAKYLLNGPCGGSRDGWCEVYPGVKRCLYVRVYERLAAHGCFQEGGTALVPPRDWALNNTSSWVNFFSGRDHAGLRKK
jgi:methylenetetrahydrofolate reductase (NADPH)